MKFLLFILISCPCFVSGQTLLKGKIADTKTGLGVAYATIGLAKENRGLNADENGSFILKSNLPGDSIIASSVGYYSHKIAIADFLRDTLILLKQKEKALADVIIENKKNWTTTTLNRPKKCADYGLVTTGFQTQVAQHLQAPVSNCFLSAVRICTNQPAFLFHETSVFRIRIYDRDSVTGSPTDDLCDEIIEINSKNRVVNINLEPYKIRIPHKDFFIAVEWLKIPLNYEDQKQKIKEEKATTDIVVYRPSIGIIEHPKDALDTWMLTYRYKWSRMYNGKDNTTAISATVKY